MNDIGHNSQIDTDTLNLWVDEILKHHATLASYAGEHMQRCKSVREMISEAYDRAKDAGLTKRALKVAVEKILIERKYQAKLDGLEEHRDEAVAYVELLTERHPELAGLPLFEAERKARDGIGL